MAAVVGSAEVEPSAFDGMRCRDRRDALIVAHTQVVPESETLSVAHESFCLR
ncbi:MAG: hypothetical protein M3374_02750 [Pseudomonadota bacterium]|nr:hypothetical protein [Pseudomonadota bacterium]